MSSQTARMRRLLARSSGVEPLPTHNLQSKDGASWDVQALYGMSQKEKRLALEPARQRMETSGNHFAIARWYPSVYVLTRHS